MSSKPTTPIFEVTNSAHLSVFPSTTRTSNLDDNLSWGTMVGDLEHWIRLKKDEEHPQNQMMIDILPDNVLLEIFAFYKEDHISHLGLGWSWITLIHVCRRWRHIIFGSPRRLDLRLVFSGSTPTSLLDIWPPFPIVIFSGMYKMMDEECLGNIIAVLECPERISIIFIHNLETSSTFEKLMAAMHGPFPALTSCTLSSSYNLVSMPVLPETFLGGSAPNLELFHLWDIPFPTFPKFILSSTQIQDLLLGDIPDSGYISPESMVTCLAALPHLSTLFIGFRSPLSRPVGIRPRHLKCTVLPSLITHSFEGVSEYFEDFVARIDTPKLRRLTVSFFMDLIFDLPQLRNFVRLTPRAKQANMMFTTRSISVVLWSQSHFNLEIKCERLDWQLSSMTQIFSQQLPFLSYVKYFQISDPRLPFDRKDCPDVDPSQWLELFRLLISVESLFVSEGLVNYVTASLKDLKGAMAMEVFPSLRNLSLEGLQPSGSVQDDIQSFVTARQLTNHPVLVHAGERQRPFPPPP